MSEQFMGADSRSSAVDHSMAESLPSPRPAPLGFSHHGDNDNRGINGNSSVGKNITRHGKPVTPIPPSLLTSTPASPPTPAPSPTPHHRLPQWPSTEDEEDTICLANARAHFASLSNAKKQRFLEGVLSLCDMPQLSFVSSFVGPRLRKDPFSTLPAELCLRVSIRFPDFPRLRPVHQSFGRCEKC